MRSLGLVEQWPVDNVAVAVIGADGRVLGTHGDQDRVFRLASVTKLLTAYGVLVAIEEGAVEWDQPAGPEGATVRHLIAHTSGLAFDSPTIQAPPGQRRIYSNAGFGVLAEFIHESTGIPFADYLAEGVFAPLGMAASVLVGSAGAGAESTCGDLARFAVELQSPTLVSKELMAEASTVAFPGLNGVLPGYGNQKPNDWGLGFEIRDGKSPHWTGTQSSPRTFGHFGQSGTFLWVDPEAQAACVALADRDFGPWAIEAWTPFTDAVLADLRDGRA
ncbi:CubicO group peptidase, beta-lactamase class C family [Actinokineospora alba]|uniref:CubicO group peptidase, beta-lactamase class C family n=1 Tax=Actinokineospora alba TaxID=504798 RepID=A0A1H0SD44_9PSEU|nr:serine hydrolase domain-containing protein [Actinokineospora alba]TDP66638.1 CubicO group peptidase (beta-lactamase class C family) [Actinokineospora alba]SDI53291.1 CubicO group peptidase, beta-lactamase class C family [Actinokineospora alba]SDP39607.1 CubicO group peptidase, beta-lactamase class C family [Actinokineospora alba]